MDDFWFYVRFRLKLHFRVTNPYSWLEYVLLYKTGVGMAPCLYGCRQNFKPSILSPRECDSLSCDIDE